ncbi:hypothetical protein [Mesorhizobium sp.]|uniref:hypothetical protein n=1 Tax=Mesorhizobium sp. TaxID=1871066 RepID=UPI0025D8FB44|nr:hypothetical protein [Mesorhizobium sp.]
MATRLKLVEVIVERYRSSCRADKQRVLGRARLSYRLSSQTCDPGAATSRCGSLAHQTVSGALWRRSSGGAGTLWEASYRLCSNRLKPLIPILLPALERHGRLDLDAELRDKLLTTSAFMKELVVS